jgi:hypothetical protein
MAGPILGSQADKRSGVQDPEETYIEDDVWYTWTGLHFIRELLGTSGLKEGEAGTVGEQSP